MAWVMRMTTAHAWLPCCTAVQGCICALQKWMYKFFKIECPYCPFIEVSCCLYSWLFLHWKWRMIWHEWEMGNSWRVTDLGRGRGKRCFLYVCRLVSYCVCSVLCDSHHLLIRVGKEDMLTISGNGQLWLRNNISDSLSCRTWSPYAVCI